jgi:hypothetical protein
VRIRFVGYSGDCVVTGLLELPGGRLTDALNTSEAVDLVEGVAEALDDGRCVATGQIRLDRGELYAAEALDTGSGADRRIQTVRHRVVVFAGPYHIEGWLHAHPGALPTIAFARRGMMVPLTEAEIRYTCAGETRTDKVPILLVNRDLADRLEKARPSG